MTQPENHNLIRYAADVAKVIEELGDPSGSVQWYVESVTFGYDGETHRGVRVAPDEFGGYGVVVEDPS